MPSKNPFEPPKATLKTGPQGAPGSVHKHQRVIAAVWILIGVVTGCSAIYDAIKTLSIGGNAIWFLVILAVFVAFAAACLIFGHALWVLSGRALRVGKAVSIAGCFLLGLLFVSNLSNGILRSQPLSLLGALLYGAGFWFCVVSLRLCRSYARIT